MKKILITGGAGFIGSHLVLELNKKGYEITVLDNLLEKIHGDRIDRSPSYVTIKDKVKFILGDVTNRKDWEKALHTQEVIIHLASETGTGQSMYEIEQYNQVNIMGTALLWDILAHSEHSIKKVIIASSRAVYGEGKYRCVEDGIVYPFFRNEEDLNNRDFYVKCPLCNKNIESVSTDENSVNKPISIYGFTKQAQEKLSMIAGKSLNIPVVIFRYQNVYGPFQSLSNPYTGILPLFINRIKTGLDIQIFEDGKESRDFVYIDDVVRATIMGIEDEAANFEIYNVGTGVKMEILTIVKMIKDIYKSRSGIKVTYKYRIGDIRDNYADIKKIKSQLGFEPKVNLRTGLLKLIEWIDKQENVSNNYLNSLEEIRKMGMLK
jgi:dTDP-L-rhamnose 4-epimerase